jgi:hypothetical protein
MDSDDDMRRHCLDPDVARQASRDMPGRLCPSIGLVTWRWRVQSCWRRSNDGCVCSHVEGSRTMVVRGSGDGVWVVVAVDGCDGGGGTDFLL